MHDDLFFWPRVKAKLIANRIFFCSEFEFEIICMKEKKNGGFNEKCMSRDARAKNVFFGFCVPSLRFIYKMNRNLMAVMTSNVSSLRRGIVMQMQNMKIKNPNGLTVKDGTSLPIDSPYQHVDVLILGAGLAGLGAATAINRANRAETKPKQICSFLVLEAQSRAGGRVNTVELIDFAQKRQIIDNTIECKTNQNHFEANTVDSGAQWLHGKYNFLHELSEKFDLLSDEQSEEGLGAFVYENCVEIDAFLVKKIDYVVGEILGECEMFAHRNGDDADETIATYPKSVEQFLRERFEQYLTTVQCPAERKIACDLFEWHIRFQIIDNSCMTLNDVSAKHWGKYSFNGESCQAHYNIRNGFGTVVHKLIDELDKKSVLFKKEIVRVTVNGDDSRRPRISVKCADQSVYTANHVLVTFSLGVLKANYEKIFQPKLPSFIERAINSIGFETINKLFLQFETAWWGDLDGIQLIFKNDESNVSTQCRFQSIIVN